MRVTRSDAAEAALRELHARALANSDGGPARFRSVAEAMFVHYAGDVRRAAERLHVPDSRVDDVCGATWEAIPQALEQFKGDSSFHTWLLKIAANKAKDELRRVKAKREGVLVAHISRMFTAAPSHERPSRAYADEETRHLAMRIIAQLEPEDRELVVLHLSDELSFAEIARRLGLKASTVQKRWTSLQRRLRELFLTARVG